MSQTSTKAKTTTKVPGPFVVEVTFTLVETWLGQVGAVGLDDLLVPEEAVLAAAGEPMAWLIS